MVDIKLSRRTQAVTGDDISRAYVYMLWGSLAFASMGMLSHLAGERCDWRVVALARTSLALLFSLCLALTSGVRLVLFRPRTLWMRSISGSIGLLCAFYSLTHLPVSTSLTLTNTFPVWVTLLAWPLLGLRPTLSNWLAVAAGFVGVLLIQQPYLSGGMTAVLAALASAFCTAVAMIGLNRLGNVDSRAVVVHFSGVSAVFAGAYLLLSKTDGGVRGDFTDPLLLVLLVGVGVAGTLGQLGITRAFALGNPSRVAVVGLTQIVFAFMFDLLLSKYRINWLTVCGVVLVAAPTAWLLMHNPLRREPSIHSSTI